MDWSLCIATLNRQDALLRTLEFAAAQTVPPAQIVIVDVSDDWQESRTKAQAVLAAHPDITLDYITSDIRSSATQRNRGLQLCKHDIVFLIDDDSFMYPDCAEEILKVYTADKTHEVACVAAVLRPELPPPPAGQDTPLPGRKKSGKRSRYGLVGRFLHTTPGHWINTKILLQNKDELFLKYDEPRLKEVPSNIDGMNVVAASFMPGCAMTVRRSIALAEPFDASLRYYAAFEDLDVAYRYARHGAVLQARSASLHHYEAEGGRMKRKKVIIFQMLNMLVFIKRHAANPEALLGRYHLLMWRRLLGEALKDLLSGRWTFPQMAGALIVLRKWRLVWDRDIEELDQWYPGFQKEILEKL